MTTTPCKPIVQQLLMAATLALLLMSAIMIAAAAFWQYQCVHNSASPSYTEQEIEAANEYNARLREKYPNAYDKHDLCNVMFSIFRDSSGKPFIEGVTNPDGTRRMRLKVRPDTPNDVISKIMQMGDAGGFDISVEF